MVNEAFMVNTGLSLDNSRLSFWRDDQIGRMPRYDEMKSPPSGVERGLHAFRELVMLAYCPGHERPCGTSPVKTKEPENIQRIFG